MEILRQKFLTAKTGAAMTNKATSKNKQGSSRRKSSPGRNLLLTLSLVPLVIGILLIGAWVLDISIFDESQLHVTVGILFLLLSFTLSNVIQKRWRLAAGWGLLMFADIIVLIWFNVWAQMFAVSVGLVGVVFIGIEFYKQYQQGKSTKAKKRKAPSA
jgi:cation transport ATPase